MRFFTLCFWWSWRLTKTGFIHGPEGISWLLTILCRRLCSTLHYACATSLQSKALWKQDLNTEFQMCLPWICIAQLLCTDLPVFLNVCMCCREGPFTCVEFDNFYSLISVAVLCLILKLLGNKNSSLGVTRRTSEG